MDPDRCQAESVPIPAQMYMAAVTLIGATSAVRRMRIRDQCRPLDRGEEKQKNSDSTLSTVKCACDTCLPPSFASLGYSLSYGGGGVMAGKRSEYKAFIFCQKLHLWLLYRTFFL